MYLEGTNEHHCTVSCITFPFLNQTNLDICSKFQEYSYFLFPFKRQKNECRNHTVLNLPFPDQTYSMQCNEVVLVDNALYGPSIACTLSWLTLPFSLHDVSDVIVLCR